LYIGIEGKLSSLK